MLLYDKTTSVLILQCCHLLGAIVRAIRHASVSTSAACSGLAAACSWFFMRAGLQGSAVAEECLEERNYCEDSSSTIFIERRSYASKPVTKCTASEELSPYAWSASVLRGRFVYDCKKPSDMLIALSVGPSSSGLYVLTPVA